jgi:predicted NUDIX family NTP pyrophosphohydrolase
MKTGQHNANYSAGVLLYRVRNGKNEYLLGKDVKYNSWSDFGGKNDLVDNKQPLKTAVREFYEETCGVIINMHDMLDIIRLKSVKIQCSSYKKKTYYMFVVKYENNYVNIESVFADQFTFLNQTNVCMKFKEKNEIKWFDEMSIVNNKSLVRGVFYNSFVNNLDEIHRVTT